MSLAKDIMKDALVDHLRATLKQTIDDLEALTAKRREIVQDIANQLATFKVGDVVTAKRFKPMKIEKIIGAESYWPDDETSLPKIEVFYAGRMVLKDGSLGKDRKDTRYASDLRLATPDEYTALKDTA